MRKFFELQAFKIFMLWVRHALWCSCCSVSVIIISVVVPFIGVVVLSLYGEVNSVKKHNYKI